MHIINFFIFLTFFFTAAYPSSFPYLQERAKGVGLALINPLEQRKTQHTELEKAFADLKKRADDALKIAARAQSKVALEISEAYTRLKSASDSQADFLNKTISLLNDRKQNIIDCQELWKEITENTQARLKLLDDYIEFLQSRRPEPKPAYLWKEFRDLQIKSTEQFDKIEGYKVKRDTLRKQKNAKIERLASLEKQYSVKTKEREKVVSHVDTNHTNLHNDAEVLTQELNSLQEKIDYTKLVIENFDIQAKLWDDSVDLEQQKYIENKAFFEQIESRLVLDYNDVEVAKAEAKNESHRALAIRENINRFREPKKQEKERVSLELDVLKDKLSQLKNTGIKENADLILTKANISRLKALHQVLEKEIELLDAKKDLAENVAHEKEVQFNMVEIRYKLKIEIDNLDELAIAFINKRDTANGILKDFKEKRTQAITALIETNHLIDKIKMQQQKLRDKRNNLFRGRENQLREMLEYFEETHSLLETQLQLTQAYLAVNADLIMQEEKIVNQYNLIIAEIETKQRTFDKWKRSPRAISIEALLRAVLEAETFLKKIYWETPSHFKLSNIIDTIKPLKFFSYLLMLLCALLYTISFFVLRSTLDFIRQRGSGLLENMQGHTRYLYLHLFLAFIDFARTHFTALFTWFFIFLHVVFDFSFVFASLTPFVSNYTVSLFYLISIPLLVYFSRCFINQLQELNKKLRYLLFAERLQDKFIVLVTIFCYTSAILLPFKLAFVAYTEATQSEFVTLILAAYSLILVIVLSLLFSKEDVLKFIPSGSRFLMWLKRKIDKHYYSVFLFMMSLLILSNPYIGYSKLAWFLAMAIPSSIAIFYLLFAIHYYIRRYAIFMFMKEDEDEFIDKFEHAKTYYSFFVIFSFMILLLSAFLLISRIWGFAYTPHDLWIGLSERWVVRFGSDSKLGFVQFSVLTVFVVSGFIVSSLMHRFILNKLFDILRSEPGTQNTIIRISHYTIVFLATLMGMYAVNLDQFIFLIGGSFLIALGFMLKDIGSDLVSGFFVLIERPVEIGNYIQIENIQGTVHKISARSTTIITSKNHSVIIPNKDLVSKWIINWGHGRFAVGFEVNIRVEPKSDPDKVRKILFSVVQANTLILKVPGIVARLEDIEESALFFLVRAFISARRVKEQWEIAAALRTEILKAFRENGIVLATPARIVSLNNPLQPGSEPQPKAIEIKFDK
jgi:small-conductance mechanosensitive channel